MPRPLMSRKRKGRSLPLPENKVRIQSAHKYSTRKLGMNSRYTGSFPYPRIRASKDKAKVPKNGSSAMIEGNIDACGGANVAYVGFQSFIRTMSGSAGGAPRAFLCNPVFHMCVALLRKYLRKHYDVELESVEQTWRDLNIYTVDEAPVTDLETQPKPFDILLWSKATPHNVGSSSVNYPVIDYYRPGGSSTTGGIAISLNENFMTTAGKLAVAILSNKEFGAYPHNATDNTTYEFYGISMREQGYTNGTTVDFKDRRAIMRVDNMKISIKTHNTIYIQNQTTSDANSLSTDVIDTNPIKGRIYAFSDPLPVCRYVQRQSNPPANVVSRQWKLMHDSNGDGVIYPDVDISENAGDYTNMEWAQLPSTDMFLNCKSYTGVALEPGEMKKFQFGFKYYGYINRFLRGLDITGLSPAAGPYLFPAKSGSLGKALGTSILFAFDKRLSTGTGGVELAVQRHSSCTVSLGATKKTTMYPVRYREQAITQDDTS